MYTVLTCEWVKAPEVVVDAKVPEAKISEVEDAKVPELVDAIEPEVKVSEVVEVEDPEDALEVDAPEVGGESGDETDDAPEESPERAAKQEEVIYPVISFLVKPVRGSKMILPDFDFAVKRQKCPTQAEINRALDCAERGDVCYSWASKPPSERAKVKADKKLDRSIDCHTCLTEFVDQAKFKVEIVDGELRLRDFAVTKATPASVPPKDGDVYDLRPRAELTETKLLEEFKALSRVHPTYEGALYFKDMVSKTRKRGIKLAKCVAALNGPVLVPLWYTGTYVSDRDQAEDATYLARGLDGARNVDLDGKPTGAALTNHSADWTLFLLDVDKWYTQNPGLWGEFPEAAAVPKSDMWQILAKNVGQPPRTFHVNKHFFGELSGIWECGMELTWSYGRGYWLYELFKVELSDAEIEEALKKPDSQSWKLPDTPYHFNDMARMILVSEAVAYFDPKSYLESLMKRRRELTLSKTKNRRGQPRQRLLPGEKLVPLVMSPKEFPELYERSNFPDVYPGYLFLEKPGETSEPSVQVRDDDSDSQGSEPASGSQGSELDSGVQDGSEPGDLQPGAAVSNLDGSFPLMEDVVSDFKEFIQQDVSEFRDEVVDEYKFDNTQLEKMLCRTLMHIFTFVKTQLSEKLRETSSVELRKQWRVLVAEFKDDFEVEPDMPLDEDARLGYDSIVGQCFKLSVWFCLLPKPLELRADHLDEKHFNRFGGVKEEGISHVFVPCLQEGRHVVQKGYLVYHEPSERPDSVSERPDSELPDSDEGDTLKSISVGGVVREFDRQETKRLVQEYSVIVQEVRDIEDIVAKREDRPLGIFVATRNWFMSLYRIAQRNDSQSSGSVATSNGVLTRGYSINPKAPLVQDLSELGHRLKHIFVQAKELLEFDFSDAHLWDTRYAYVPEKRSYVDKAFMHYPVVYKGSKVWLKGSVLAPLIKV